MESAGECLPAPSHHPQHARTAWISLDHAHASALMACHSRHCHQSKVIPCDCQSETHPLTLCISHIRLIGNMSAASHRFGPEDEAGNVSAPSELLVCTHACNILLHALHDARMMHT